VQDLYDSWKEAIAAAFDEAVREDPRRNRRWLAIECDVAESTIKRVLEGAIVPSDALKYRLAAVFGKRVDELFRYPNIIPPITWRSEAVAS
jgi:DNA-binding XRE family transcriptional regulator